MKTEMASKTKDELRELIKLTDLESFEAEGVGLHRIRDQMRKTGILKPNGESVSRIVRSEIANAAADKAVKILFGG